MDEPWSAYYDELRQRAEEVPRQEFDREADMAEAAHDAYEATADRLVARLGWPEEEALAITRHFGRVVKAWIDRGGWDWDDLRERLEAAGEEWEPSVEKRTG